jgi:hypothetical protein
LARIPPIAIEEVRELITARAARNVVVDGRVAKVEVDVAPGILMRGVRKYVGCVVIEAMDGPFWILCPVVAGVFAFRRNGESERNEC